MGASVTEGSRVDYTNDHGRVIDNSCAKQSDAIWSLTDIPLKGIPYWHLVEKSYGSPEETCSLHP